MLSAGARTASPEPGRAGWYHQVRVGGIPMDVGHRRIHRVDVLSLNGRMLPPEAAILKEHIDALFAEGRYRIVLDLADLEYISSGGLRVLIEARKHLQQAKPSDGGRGDIRLVNVKPRIKDVLSLTGFTSFFEIYDDLTEAVGSF
jgi:anti-sigma B factor antagonist